MELINDEILLRLNIYILAIKYLEKRALHFTKITGDNEKTNRNNREVETVSNSEEKIKKKGFT